MEKAGFAGDKVVISHVFNDEANEFITKLIKDKYPDCKINSHLTGGLCGYYAEKGGLILGYEIKKSRWYNFSENLFVYFSRIGTLISILLLRDEVCYNVQVKKRRCFYAYFEIIKAVILGIVQGISEFLPISSTGHIILVNEFLQLQFSLEFVNTFCGYSTRFNFSSSCFIF